MVFMFSQFTGDYGLRFALENLVDSAVKRP